MPISRLLSATFGLPALSCMLGLTALTTACKTNKVSAQPPAATPRPASPKPTRRQQTPVNQPATPARPITPPAAQQPQPRLGQMLSAEEERRYNTLIDESLGNARVSLNSIGSRSLTREQQTTVQQIQDFIQQAQDARKADLLAARGLSDKAAVLARDLVRSLR